jgi:hypothetical protein
MESRLEPARRRAGTAKRALTGAAAVGFVAAILLARASHPGHATPASGSGSVSSSGSSPELVISPSEGESDDSGFFGQAPQVQTHVS